MEFVPIKHNNLAASFLKTYTVWRNINIPWSLGSAIKHERKSTPERFKHFSAWMPDICLFSKALNHDTQWVLRCKIEKFLSLNVFNMTLRDAIQQMSKIVDVVINAAPAVRCERARLGRALSTGDHLALLWLFSLFAISICFHLFIKIYLRRVG